MFGASSLSPHSTPLSSVMLAVMRKLPCHSRRSIPSPSLRSAERWISFLSSADFGDTQCKISNFSVFLWGNHSMQQWQTMVPMPQHQWPMVRRALCPQNPQDEPWLARMLPVKGKAAEKPVLQSPHGFSGSRRMVTSVVAFQTLAFLPELSLRQL